LIHAAILMGSTLLLDCKWRRELHAGTVNVITIVTTMMMIMIMIIIIIIIIIIFGYNEVSAAMFQYVHG
jgi:hypothetical protein